MTTLSLLERAGRMSDEIRAEAQRVDPVKVVFTLLMILPVVIGYVVAYLLKGVWAVATFLVVAFLVGYRHAAGPDFSQLSAKLKRPRTGS